MAGGATPLKAGNEFAEPAKWLVEGCIMPRRWRQRCRLLKGLCAKELGGHVFDRQGTANRLERAAG